MQPSIDNLLRELEELAVKRAEAAKVLQVIDDRANEVRRLIKSSNPGLVSELDKALSGLKQLRSLNREEKTPISSVYDGYFAGAGLIQKTEFILNRSGKYKTVREIVEIVKELEGLKEDGTLIQDYSWIISDQIKNEERFSRFKNEGKGQYLIGLKSWFNKDGSPKGEYNDYLPPF